MGWGCPLWAGGVPAASSLPGDRVAPGARRCGWRCLQRSGTLPARGGDVAVLAGPFTALRAGGQLLSSPKRRRTWWSYSRVLLQAQLWSAGGCSRGPVQGDVFDD